MANAQFELKERVKPGSEARSWYDPLYFLQAQKAAQAEPGAWSDHRDAWGGPLPGAAATAEPRPVNTQGIVLARGKRDNAGMDIEQLEQLAAVIVTAGLVAGNFLLFTPWRNGEDPRHRQPESLMPQNESIHQSELGSFKESFIRLMANRS